jgi:hypothetical protein
MSESVLQALMQLFAIVASAALGDGERRGRVQRNTVEQFLNQQIALNQVERYLEIYDAFYQQHLARQQAKRTSYKHTSSSSVRVLRICAQINEELQLNQKFIVLARLIEFARQSGHQINSLERDFIDTVSDSFYITRQELGELMDFAAPEELPQAPPEGQPSLLRIVDSTARTQGAAVGKVLYHEHLDGEMWVYHASRAGIYMLRYFGRLQLLVGGRAALPRNLYVLSHGSSIRVGNSAPIFYTTLEGEFAPERFGQQVCLEVKDIAYRFADGTMGIHPMGFSHTCGQLVGIMGSSGAGKSTLLSVLNGSARPQQGEVRINGVEIYQEPEQAEGVIGYVSQDDLLVEELSVFQNLYYSARLSFGGMPHEELVTRVQEILISLGLWEIRHMPVGNPLDKRISGGQRKRLNIALELIREPSILFLDEPTSGLSSRDSENLVAILKDLAIKGKLIYIVIHQPPSAIFKMLDRLLVLDTGGYLIYEGNPIEALEYFQEQGDYVGLHDCECALCGNVTPEQLFDIIENPVVDEYGNVTRQRRRQPEEWAAYFAATSRYSGYSKQPPPPIEGLRHSTRRPGWVGQLRVFTVRDALGKIANRQFLIINLLEAPLMALLLAFLVRYFDASSGGYTLQDNVNLPVYLLMAVVVAFFVGLSGTAEDIIRDRKIRKRESFLNLSWGAYLSAKMVNMTTVSIYQSFAFTLIGNTIMGIEPAMLPYYWLILLAVWMSAGTLGLLISDSFKTVVAIYILIPFLVIPQLILSGIIVKFDKLNPELSNPANIPWYGEAIVARWAYEALAVHQFRQNAYQAPLYGYEQVMALADYKRNYWLRALTSRCNTLLVPNDSAQAMANWELIRHELQADENPETGSGIKLEKEIDWHAPTPENVKRVQHHLQLLSGFYARLYTNGSRLRDSTIRILQEYEAAHGSSLAQLKASCYNTALARLVRANDETDRIVLYHNRLVWHCDPIFQLPTSPWLKAHFYAPYKRLGARYLSTYWVNLGVLIASIGILYTLLYLRVPKRIFRKKSVESI